MTDNNITVSVASTAYPVKRGSLQLGTKVDEVSRFQCILRDDNGTAHFHQPQQVSVDDSSGNLFTGIIHTDDEDKEPAQSMLWHTIDCLDPTEKARKRTLDSGAVFTGQYTGIIAAMIHQQKLIAENVVANYALRHDTTQADFASGTLSGTVATGNVGDGDLELALAGSAVNFTVNATTNIYSTNGTNTGSAITCNAMNAIAFTASCTVPGSNASYLFMSIMQNVGYTIVSGDQFIYDVWISKSSKKIMAAVDFVCTDGTTLRDANVFDGQWMGPNSDVDLTGLADNQWYSRVFNIGFLAGKTISFVSVEFGGNATGDYAAYFRRIKIINGATTNLTVFTDTTTALPSTPPQAMNRSGYTNESVSVVQAYDPTGFISTQNVSFSPAGIYQSSLVQWSITIPANCSVAATATMDDTPGTIAAVFKLVTNGGAFPGLIPGMDLTNLSGYIDIFLYNNSDAPTVSPSFTSLIVTVNPSYTATKNDIRSKTKITSDYTGVLTNLTANNNILYITGYQHKLDFGLPGVTLYGNGGPAYQQVNRSLRLNAANGTDAKLLINDAGNWQNFIASVDVQFVSTSLYVGLFFRETNYGNGNDNYAYLVYLNTTTLGFGRGSNSSSGSNGTFTSIASQSLSLSTNTWYTITAQANGNTFDVWLNGVHYISGATDSTYTASGGIGFRTFNATGGSADTFYRNFGVVAALSGTYVTPAIDIHSAGSVLAAFTRTQAAGDLAQSTLKTEISLNNGSTWTDCAGVQAATQSSSAFIYDAETIPGLAPTTNVSSLTQVKLRLTLSIASPAAHLETQGTIFYIISGYSASGTRITSALLLSAAGRNGATLVAWNAVTPPGTSLAVATSPTGSGSWTTVSSGNGIAGITSQPALALDTFNTNTSADYTSTTIGSSNATWTWDTTNSRINGSGGNNAVLRYDGISIADSYIEADLDQVNDGGLICRLTATGAYALYLYDSAAGNVFFLFAITASFATYTQIATGSINFTRGEYHKFRLSCIGTTISVLMDGVQLASVTNSAVAGAGKAGLLCGNLIRCYNLRIQGYGDDLTGVNTYVRATLASTDPTQTPQLLDLTVAALSPDIGVGSLVATVDYSDKVISDDLADLAKKSNNYTWTIRSDNSLFFNARQTTPAPWILQSSDQSLLLAGLKVSNAGDTYRNRQKLIGVIDPVAGTNTYTVTRNNTGGFAGTVSQSAYAADEGGSGIVEQVEDVSSQNLTVAAAQAYGDSLLQTHGVIGRTIQLTTRRTGLRVGQYLSVFITEHNLFDAAMLITAVDVAAVIVSDMAGGSTMEYRYNVTATEGPNTGSWARLMATALK